MNDSTTEANHSQNAAPSPAIAAIAPATAPTGALWVTEGQLSQLHWFVTNRAYVSVTGWIAQVRTQKT
jgi:hypothetical protein